jgi:hypothetical protein
MYQSTQRHKNTQNCQAGEVVNCRSFNTGLGSNQACPCRSVVGIVVMEWGFLQVLNFALSVSLHQSSILIHLNATDDV